MRLWHKDLIPYLPRQQLLGQWRECCAIAVNIAAKGTPNHILVNKVMEYPFNHLWTYCGMIKHEMGIRGYKVETDFLKEWEKANNAITKEELFSEWHTERYLRQCLSNLQEKADCGAIPAEEWERVTDRWPGYK